MIACLECGQENGDTARFCSACNAYLSWDGRPVRTQTDGTGTRSEVPAVAGSGDGRSESVGDSESADVRAGAVTAVPPAPAQPAVVQPAPTRDRLPIAPEPPPPPPVPSAGELRCRSCGAGNDPGRELCRSCGLPLRTEVPRSAVWWRRLLDRSRNAVSVGDRPGRDRRRRARTIRRRVRTVALLALPLLAVLALLGPLRDTGHRWYDSARARFTTSYEPVPGLSARSSSAARGHAAEAAIDGVRDSYWAEGVRGLGLNQSLTVRLERTVDLDRVGIWPGASPRQQQFLAQPRPRELRLTFPDGRSRTVSLRDEAAYQEFDLDARSVDEVRIELLSVYSGQSDQDTAIAEVEFFTKR